MIRIIPAIDIINGQCVRLTEGDFAQQKTYDSSPVEVAKRFADQGIKFLHLVDLDGARAKKPVNLKILEEIAANTSLNIDFGGGIQSDESVAAAFSAGASQITAGSIAVREPLKVATWLQTYGKDKIIVGADFRDQTISINAWADQSDLTLEDFIADYLTRGGDSFICTDVSKDGRLEGPATETYKKLVQIYPSAKFIASGGVTTITDVNELNDSGLFGAIIGKAIYEGTITFKELKPYIC